MRPKVPKGYNPDYLHCRTFGHSWHVGNGESEGTAFYRFVLICDTCKTRRLEVVNRRTGSKASRRYEYYVAVRLEADGKQVDWEATARFEDSEDAIEFMLRLADEIEANGLSGGLTMTSGPWSGPW
jgi:hypothetical protein